MTDDLGVNIMQRVFDALPTDGIGVSVGELALRAKVTRDSVISALTRLKTQRALERASCVGGVWLYRRRADALRPMDRRGGKRQQMAEVAV
jgi:hypothetical protein